MRPEPASVSEAGAWLQKAAQDLRAAGVDLEAQPSLAEDAAFHAQQTVEKSLKALLTLHDRPIRKTHDLVALGIQCVEIDASLEPLLREAGRLTKYAWLYRYPGTPAPLSEEAAAAAVGLAAQVFERMSQVVESAGRDSTVEDGSTHGE